MPAPEPPEPSVWSMGSRTVKQAQAETGLSRDELFDLMREGVLVWMAHGGLNRRLIAWKSLVQFLEREHAAFERRKAGAVQAHALRGE